MSNVRLSPRAGPRIVALVTCLLVGACGGDVASPSPVPTARPKPAPTATATASPGGPISEIGRLVRATWETPLDFIPRFTFDLRGDGWQLITAPDAYGFVLAEPSAFSPEALMGALRPVATSIDAFVAEVTAGGLFDGAETSSNVTIDGVPARSFSVTLSTPADAFRALNAAGDVMTSFGGDLPENRLVFVAHPDGAFVILLSLASDASVEPRFVFDALLSSIQFR
jgi:hypothetical protein